MHNDQILAVITKFRTDARKISGRTLLLVALLRIPLLVAWRVSWLLIALLGVALSWIPLLTISLLAIPLLSIALLLSVLRPLSR